MIPAKAGEAISEKAKAYWRKTFTVRLPSYAEQETVHPPTDGGMGRHICIDCGEIMQNNLGRDMHPKKHRAAWLSAHSGEIEET